MVHFSNIVQKAFEEKYGRGLYEYLSELSFDAAEKLEFIATAANDEGYARGINSGLNISKDKAYNNGYKDGLLDVISKIHDLMRELE